MAVGRCDQEEPTRAPQAAERAPRNTISGDAQLLEAPVGLLDNGRAAVGVLIDDEALVPLGEARELFGVGKLGRLARANRVTGRRSQAIVRVEEDHITAGGPSKTRFEPGPPLRRHELGIAGGADRERPRLLENINAPSPAMDHPLQTAIQIGIARSEAPQRDPSSR